MSTEEEIRKTYRVYQDEEGIIRFDLLDSINSVEDNVVHANLVKKDIEEMIQSNGDIKVVTHFQGNMKGAGYPTPTARKIFQEIINNPKIIKLAIVAPNFLFSSIVRFTLGPKKDEKIEVFSNLEKALNWIKGIKEKSKGYHIEPKM